MHLVQVNIAQVRNEPTSNAFKLAPLFDAYSSPIKTSWPKKDCA